MATSGGGAAAGTLPPSWPRAAGLLSSPPAGVWWSDATSGLVLDASCSGTTSYLVLDGVAGDLPTSTTKTRIRLYRPP